ncbi:glycoside hydrolase family 11 protein [Solwaraspora sp. WMMD1047]|uniref:glycoside hydrolase family 11 protein n=1 Tax=Solwaraspora sp. WMMD1047 TaxID=3016102 RepID=UPI0024177C82|nr:glycoside hydrolase family 11 protein [Solwaraspora sp. WMMD1047]MDG4832902.1 glycoside hydrolase family 11 protein [Solwaraspora sp. WMMD1047]
MSETPDIGSPVSRRDRRGRVRLAVGAACATLLAITVTASAPAAHAETHPTRPVINTNQTGEHGGYFYAFWKDSGDAAMTLGPGGQYSSAWNTSTNNWFGGKGWATGDRRTVHYRSTFNPNGTAYLALYGYMTDPLVEYYIMESWGIYRPTGTLMGTVVTDGGVYDIYRAMRYGPPGAPIHYQYYNIRQQKRTSGSIDTGAHFDAWADAGMTFGAKMGYMIMATEGYQSSGSSNVWVYGSPR